MTTMSLGAAKRHAIDETVRLRMAAILPGDDEPSGGPTGAGGSGTGSSGAASSPAGVASSSVRAASPPAGDRSVPVAAPSPPSLPLVPDVGGAADSGEEPVYLPGAGAGPRFSSFPSFASALALDRRAVAGLAVLLLFAVGYAVQHFWLARPETVAVPALAAAATPAPADQSVPGDGPAAASRAGPGPEAGDPRAVVVDIGGRVHLPGLHTLPGGSRVADALRAAGGPLPETDTRNLNLARVLTDGEQILVGEPGPVPVTGSGSGPPGPSAPRAPVSLNRATLEQLDTLPGVGPTLAQRILAYRSSHGSFRSLDQLRQVSGIGARTYAELRPLLTL
ncbi:helix-hairpin-helix domain-containing protein [Kitasatospora sp. NPDC056783]|uniref:helix-hairpin-helix domain-containing protein n=1 Tax=Kitasatospora sp. NPDC056783 TaxID=3345943 RepID=UPI0036BBB812